MRDSVPSTRYSSVCNVLRQWNIRLIPTYRVYPLYDTSHVRYLKLSIVNGLMLQYISTKILEVVYCEWSYVTIHLT